MKKFMIIIFGTGEEMADLPDEAREEAVQKWQDWNDELEQKDILELASALQPEGVVISGKEKQVRDGLNAEDVDLVVGGFYVIKASSMDDAVDVAKGCPAFDLEGVVEIRELMDM